MFAYDDASRMLSATSQRYDNEVAFTYNQDSTLASESLTVDASTPSSQTYTVSLGYDPDDRVTTITHPDGSTVTRSYTDRDQLARVDFTPAGGSLGNIATFTYDAAMRESSRTYDNGLTRSTTYSRQDHLPTSLDVTSGGGAGGGGVAMPGLSFAYAYDANKNPTSQTTGDAPGHPMAGYSWTASHDAADRLVDWQRTQQVGPVYDQAWNLSLVGDWHDTTLNGQLQTRTHNDAHEILTVDPSSQPQAALQHDPKGNLTRDDAPGNALTYQYDFDNRLASATVPAAAASAGRGMEGTHTYTYDALGRRVSKTVDNNDGTFTMVVFICKGQQVVADYAATGATPTVPGASNPTQQHIHGSYIDEHLAVVIGGATYYHHTNRMYNIAGLTNAAGNVVERYAYTPYGQRTTLDPTGTTRTTSAIYNTPHTLAHQGLAHDEPALFTPFSPGGSTSV